MSVASWYYCNVLDDEASAVVPVVQDRQNAVQVDTKAPAVRPAVSLALGAEVDDELAVARSTYVLSAAFAATSEPKTVKAEPGMKELKVETVAEQVAETVETVTEEVVSETAEVVAAEPVSIETEALEEPVTGEEEVVEPAKVEAAVEETVSEVATVVETVHDAVEAVAVVEEEAVESVVGGEEERSVELEQVDDEPVVDDVAELSDVAAAAGEAPASTCEVSEEKPLDKAEDVTLDMIAEPRKLVTRMPSIPEDEDSAAGVVEESVDVDQVAEDAATDEAVELAAVQKTETVDEAVELPPAAEEEEVPAAAKPVMDDESETETQSEISEATALEAVESAEVNEEPESEIDETMVIDPHVTAQEAAAAEAQTSSYSFIPKQIRDHSYTVSSVAVALATAIAATLVARR